MIVVDEQGNVYEATYPKRAKGLVKNGRARFVDENKICLACPPDRFLEENKMNENKLTVKDIFETIGALKSESFHIGEALKQLESVRSEGPGDIGAQARANAIVDVVKCRETTLQQMLALYSKMYDDIQNETKKKIEIISEAFDRNMAFISDSDIESEDKYNALGYITDKIAELVEKMLFDKETEV